MRSVTPENILLKKRRRVEMRRGEKLKPISAHAYNSTVVDSMAFGVTSCGFDPRPLLLRNILGQDV